MNVTIKDVAKIANISYATVSRALSGHKDVNENTRKRVLEICEQVGYLPNAIARGLVTRSTNTIGLLLPDITNPYFPEVALGVEDEANRRGYNVFLCNTHWEMARTETYFKLLLGKRVEGIIISPASDETKKLVSIYNDRLPIVFIGSDPKEKDFNYVSVDNKKGEFTATEYLIKLGHRRIAFVGGNSNTSSYYDRVEGYKSALQKYGIEVDPYLIRSGSYSKECGHNAIKQFIEEGRVPTAIVTANDVVAIGIMEAAEENNLLIPQDISLVGYDDIAFASLPKIKLTTMYQPKYEFGKIAVDILFKKMGSENFKKGFHETMQSELIIRSTCRAV